MEYYHFDFIIVEDDKDLSTQAFTIAVEKGHGSFPTLYAEAEKKAIDLAKGIYMKRIASFNPKYNFTLKLRKDGYCEDISTKDVADLLNKIARCNMY